MRALQILVVAALLSIAYTQIPNMCSTDASCPICNCAADDMACAGDTDACAPCDFMAGCTSITSSRNVLRVSGCTIIRSGVSVRTLRVQNVDIPVCVMIEDGADVRTINFANSNADNCIFVNGRVTATTSLGAGNDCLLVSGRTGNVNLGPGTNTATYYGGVAARTGGTAVIAGGDGLDCVKALVDGTTLEPSNIGDVTFGLNSGCLFGEGSQIGNVAAQGNDPHFIGLVDSTIGSVTFTGDSDDGFSMIEGRVLTSSIINMGPGDDRMFIENAQVSGNIVLGTGNDDISVGCSQIWNIMGGDADDCIDVFDSTADPFNGGVLDGENGDDEIIVSDSQMRQILGGPGMDEIFDCNNQNVGSGGGQPTLNGGPDTDTCSSDSAGTPIDCENVGPLCPPPPTAVP